MRKISFGEGVERTFALFSPIVDSIKVIRSGKVRRAKLYYLRDRTGKSARISEKIRKKIGIDVDVSPETVSEENLLESNKLEETKETASKEAEEKKSSDKIKEVKAEKLEKTSKDKK